jgi:hypothetical protein
VLEAYNRANPENMLSVLCLLRLLDGLSAVRPGRARVEPPSAPGPLVADDRRGVDEPRKWPRCCDSSRPRATPAVRAWCRASIATSAPPAFLALAITLLRQRFDDGSDRRAAWSTSRRDERGRRRDRARPLRARRTASRQSARCASASAARSSRR